MGKHERKFIEDAERILVSFLNKEKVGEEDLKSNPWSKHAAELAIYIITKYPNLISAKHLGNRYDNTGDILLKLPNKEIYIEVKMSESKTSKGTLANISQDAFTENGLFENNTKKWSTFRKEKKHDRWVSRLLNKFKKYPTKVDSISNENKKRETEARYLRDISKDKKNKFALKILTEIQEKDKIEKISYLNYLAKQKQIPEMIKRFFILIKMGVHRDKEIKDLIRRENFFKEIQDLYVYYVNIDNNRVVIREENVGKKIEEILKNILEFKLVFPKHETHCKIVGVTKKGVIPLLQIVYHWKNIAQGIKTPCLNIFDLTP